MKIKISKAEREILTSKLRHIAIVSKIIVRISDVPNISGQYELNLADDEALAVRELLQELFCKQGLYENYEPNNLGLIVESLVDKLTDK